MGHSGSGKSTIVKLLSGFYKVDSGSIKIGERLLESYSKDALINTISFVFQDSKLLRNLFTKMLLLLIERQVGKK